MLLDWFARFFGHRGPAHPPLVPVKKRCTGRTVEEALHRFEDEFSDTNYQGMAIEEQVETRNGILVRYEVRWKYSVFDDDAVGRHVSWTLLAPADSSAGDPPDARFR